MVMLVYRRVYNIIIPYIQVVIFHGYPFRSSPKLFSCIRLDWIPTGFTQPNMVVSLRCFVLSNQVRAIIYNIQFYGNIMGIYPTIDGDIMAGWWF